MSPSDGCVWGHGWWGQACRLLEHHTQVEREMNEGLCSALCGCMDSPGSSQAVGCHQVELQGCGVSPGQPQAQGGLILHQPELGLVPAWLMLTEATW